MKKAYICRLREHQVEVSGDADEEFGKAFEDYLLENGRQYPETLMGLNFAGMRFDSNGHTCICYVDLDKEKIDEINHDYEYWFLSPDEIIEGCLKKLGVEPHEINCDWKKALGRTELNMLLLCFGKWKIVKCGLDYVKEGRFDSESAKSDFFSECFKNHEESLLKIMDWVMQNKNVSSLEDLCSVLNRCSSFPSEYFRRQCNEHGWRMKGLDFGEMCTDEKNILRMGSDGKCEIV